MAFNSLNFSSKADVLLSWILRIYDYLSMIYESIIADAVTPWSRRAEN
jgi:hypothetical protein